MNVNYERAAAREPYTFARPDEPHELAACAVNAIDCMRDEPEEPKTGFWRRQFSSDVTLRQRKFDWAFGVGLPVICFFFDPIVFKSGLGDRALLGKYMPFAYVLSYAAVMATIAWLLWGVRLKKFSAPLSGLFAMSALAAFAIGVVLFPFSLIGLLFLIGAMGFTPLFTSFVFLRNSVRTFRLANTSIETDRLIASFTLAASASAVIPYLINLWWGR